MSVNLRLCTHGCKIVHFESCGTCFGFGIRPTRYEHEPIPVTAGEAEDARGGHLPNKVFAPCPECESTIDGVPPSFQFDPDVIRIVNDVLGATQ